MKIKIVYFAYLTGDNWQDVICEQMNSLKGTSLYEMADEILISVVCDEDKLKRLKQHIWAKWKKIKIHSIEKINQYEFPGLRSVWEVSQNCDDCVILYFHTKGMSQVSHKRGGSDIRKILFKLTIQNYETYLNEFKKNPKLDIGMVFPSEHGFAWYNFFWIRSSYVKNFLPKPEYTSHRYYWEHWIGSEHSKKNPVTFSPFVGYTRFGNRAQFNNFRNKLWKEQSK
jgi:hypothetical protein